MRVIVFGASGMIGHGALRACLLDDTVTEVLAVVRSPLSAAHPKLRQIVHTDFTDYTAIQDQLKDLDACFYCLGVSAVGRREEEYTRVTHDYALAVAHALYAASPALTFVYVSGEGTDSTGRSRQMWARVKGRTENDLLAMPMTGYMFRPGYVQPVDGVTSRTRVYRVLYRVTAGLYPLLRRAFPRHVTTTDAVGRAMLAAARLNGAGPTVLRNPDINRLAAVGPGQAP
ncbi:MULTISPECIES: NAD-dependent epimerase/dehydratase family protein [unclassified Streptomyces]|uniref:NAD-dependent epimerase/dehydratase family protein n=1 Tax=unclassified Streptomyces TaxID=2593676 RepID=UPI002E816F40|nr:NAD-dependent epimerase/dehydratase family protein [Streptomyces sp. NBC_00589]WTI35005.1 NAD(P)H-binding protein [Streptomyces sp. NBC_00775]WUB31321.1 NAD(P)H-binding protein [Streptomyces sp. NBC_00589]